jgi:hypothetical protein
VVGAFVQDALPKAFRFGMVAALGDQNRQVAQGELAVDAMVDAAKLVWTLQLQHPRPPMLRFGKPAREPVQHGLAKEQRGDIASARQTIGAHSEEK